MKATFASYATRRKEAARNMEGTSDSNRKKERYEGVDASALSITDFISDREMRSLEKRLACARALIEGKTYNEIIASLHVSTAVIAQIAKMLDAEAEDIRNGHANTGMHEEAEQ